MSKTDGISLSGTALTKIDRSSRQFQDLLAAAKRLADKDATLWGEAASAEANIRLNWLDLPVTSRELLPQLDALSAWVREAKLSKILLCGMGGSSLAPEVISRTLGKDLTIVDTTDPDQISDVLDGDLSKTLVIVSSKSGSTVETASQFALFKAKFQSAGIQPSERILIITDPESPLDIASRASGFRVISADPKVGGRFSALTAFGLVPAALIGVDVSILIDDANAAQRHLTENNSVAVQMAYLLAQSEFAFTAFTDSGSKVPGLSDWIEQLIAESTGKDEKGLLPIVIENSGAAIGGKHPVITFDGSGDLSVVGTLGAQFIFWEWVTALLCVALKVNPFDQPNVTEAKNQTNELLSRWSDGKVKLPPPLLKTNYLEIFSRKNLESVAEYISEAISGHGYISIMAYLDRFGNQQISAIRELIATKSNTPTTFGWGPRFLHSTGQFHKGGPQVGSFIQITGAFQTEVAIPNQIYGFQTLNMAQAIGDGEALENRKLPLLRIHLRDRKNGISELLAIIKSL